jgi:4-amino-4-deoxy-L-arabinose transferase-like glycosyltransferase
MLLLAWAVHWHTFSRLELGLDGALTVDLARSPLGDMLAFNARDVHPPLFFAILKGWLWLSGLHYLTAKYLAIAASLPALPLLYQLGRRLLPARGAVLATLLLALSPASLFLAPTVRDFSLGLTLSLATAVLTLDLCRQDDRKGRRDAGRLVALAVLTAAALLTWYFHLFLLLVEAAALLYAHRRLVVAHGALALGLVLSAPWYVYVLPHITGKLAVGTTTFGGAPNLPNGPDLASGITRALFGEPWSRSTGIALCGWLLTLVLGLVVSYRINRRSAVRVPSLSSRQRPTGIRSAEILLALALLLGAGEVALTTLRWSDVGSLSRYVLPLLPYTAVFQARGLLAAPRGWRLLAAAGLAVSIPVQLFWFGLLVSGPPIDWANDPALAYVAAHAATGDAILFNDRARRGRYLLDGGPLLAAVIHSAGQAYLADSPAQAEQTATATVESAQRVWLVESSPSVDVAQRALADHAFGLPPSDVGGSVVQLFLSTAASPLQPVGATFGGLIALDAASVPSAAKPGGAIAVELVWRDVRPAPIGYTVFLHVDDAKGNLVAQHDSPPVLGFGPTNAWKAGQVTEDRFGIALPATLPSGDYDLHVGLYRGSQRLTLGDGTNQVSIGTLHVTS